MKRREGWLGIAVGAWTLGASIANAFSWSIPWPVVFAPLGIAISLVVGGIAFLVLTGGEDAGERSKREVEEGWGDGGEWVCTIYHEFETLWVPEGGGYYLARWVDGPRGLKSDGADQREAVRNLIAATKDYMDAMDGGGR